MPLDKSVNLENLASKTHGFVVADLSALAKEAAMNVLRKLVPDLKLESDEPISQEILDKIIIKGSDFEESLKVVRPSAMREVLVETPNVSWEDIGGLESTKQDLKEAVEWPLKIPESFKRLGVKPPRGILLYGPPGTGKTLLAKAVANESEANFINIKGPSLLSMWVGKSEEGIRKVFERARQVAPCIIFFDEMDALASKRGLEMGTKVTERVLNQLLAEMDGLEGLKDVTIIGATNRPDMLDPAILRPGRFDRVLLVDVPDQESRRKVFEIHLANTKIKLSEKELIDIGRRFKDEKISINAASKMTGDETMSVREIKKQEEIKKEKRVNFEDLSEKEKLIYYLAAKTEGFVGADIESIVREAAINALRKDMKASFVTIQDFDEALMQVKPSVSEETAKRYKKIEDYYIKSARAGGVEMGPMYTG